MDPAESLRIWTRGTVVCTAVFAGLLFLSVPAQADGLEPGDFVFGPTSPGKWGPPTFGTGATVTWSLMPTGPSCFIPTVEPIGCTITALSAFMPAGFKTEIISAFGAWSAVADLTFVEVLDDGAAFDAPTTSGDIRLGGHVFDGPSGTLAHGFFPPVNGLTAAGDIHFDTAELWKIGFGGPGFDVFQVAAHEIGHAIGLGHEMVATALMNPFYTEANPPGLLADDVAGAQAIYGTAVSTPEPDTMVLLAFALIGVVVSHRRASSTVV